jgi:hypothetical protein
MAKKARTSERLTIKQMEKRYPSEWILIVDPETDDSDEVVAGKVVFHSKDRDEMYREAIKIDAKVIATHYTGSIPKGTVIVL